MKKLLLAATLGLMLSSCSQIIDEGDLNVYISNVHESGIIFKTQEVRTSSAGPWFFTIEDPTVLQVAKNNIGHEVRVHYIERMCTPLRSDSQSRFITAIYP